MVNMELLLLLGSSRHLKLTSLLFSLCFVWRSEADCPRPQRGENSVLTDEALLMDKFPEGTVVTLECCNGYEKETGSATIKCQNGKWTQIELICKKMDCGVPKPQPNMRFDTSGGTLFGDMIKVTCDKGYEISGSSYKQCFSFGWMGKSKCHIQTCEKPEVVINGNHSWNSEDGPTYGQLILYNCDEGYTLTGNSSIQCGEEGVYDSPPPECIDISASLVLSTTAAAVHRDIIIRGSTAVPTRDGGHVLMIEGAEGTENYVTSSPPSFYQDYLPVILSVVCISIVIFIGVLCLHRCLLRRRKGSYDTREDLKPELLLFQNL